jgi:hypothetical protein
MMHDITDSIQSNLMALVEQLISLSVFGVACRSYWSATGCACNGTNLKTIFCLQFIQSL